MSKYFFITIDTESDNQWDLSHKQSTFNAKFIPRFQACCEKYSFLPTYLVDYSMANDPVFIQFGQEKVKNGKCEIGMHLHAWDTPPLTAIDNNATHRPYLIEYPTEVIEKKIANLTSILTQVFNCKIVSHRAGRWAINEEYISILERYGYEVDCSITPGVSWHKQIGYTNGGPDYRHERDVPHYLFNSKVLELPMTVCKMRGTEILFNKGLKRIVKDSLHSCFGKRIWLRPSISRLQDILLLIDAKAKEDSYLEFMIHSSEFMPGGSPYYENEAAINKLFTTLDEVFSRISECGYQPALLRMAKELFDSSNL